MIIPVKCVASVPSRTCSFGRASMLNLARKGGSNFTKRSNVMNVRVEIVGSRNINFSSLRVWSTATITGVMLLFPIWGCSGGSTTTPTPVTPTSAATCMAPTNVQPMTNQAITVQQNMLKRNGVPWIPHAVQLVAFVQSPQEAATVSGGSQFTPAYNHYCSGPATEMADIKAWGADSVRMQPSGGGGPNRCAVL